MGKKAEKKRLQKTKRSKSTLVFNEDARKEWLTSFSKRKKERQEKAKNDLAVLLKEEKVRQREEFREKTKKLEAKYLEKIKDVEEILKEKTEAYKCGDKTVEITEYNLVDQDDMLGINEGQQSEEEDQTDRTSDCDISETKESGTAPPLMKMPKKMSNVAVKIEKRLYKLKNKRKVSKHKANIKKQQLEAAGKSSMKGKQKLKTKAGRSRK
ncbi:nucleolar protein 12-like [Watersipora subatra]|uniref:nucleolar protein 12-like n=1 Tax=Watersipora subatra TaxID=2589382 RepID=UPI00355B3774